MRGGFLSLSPAFVKKSNPSFFIHALIHCLIHALIGGLDHAVIGCLIHAFMRCLIGLVWSYWNFPIGFVCCLISDQGSLQRVFCCGLRKKIAEEAKRITR